MSGTCTDFAKKTLFAFDCDSTLVDFGLDTLMKCLLGGNAPGFDRIRTKFAHSWMRDWIECNNELFRYAYDQGITREQIKQVARTDVPWVPGMRELLQELSKERSVDSIIVTDNNEFWISCLLDGLNAKGFFIASFASKVKWHENGSMEVVGYAPPTGCEFSTNSMCKGDVVLGFAKERGCYDRICYVGDGENDLCPALRLSARDMLYVREGFNLHKLIKEREYQLDVPTLYWSSGKDILEDFYSSMGAI